MIRESRTLYFWRKFMASEKEMIEIQQKVWKIVNEHIGPKDSNDLLMTGGVLLKVAMELYSVVLSNEDIEGLLETVKRHLPESRTQMQNKLGQRTLH